MCHFKLSCAAIPIGFKYTGIFDTGICHSTGIFAIIEADRGNLARCRLMVLEEAPVQDKNIGRKGHTYEHDRESDL